MGEQLEGLAACALAYGQAVQELVSELRADDGQTLRRSEAVLAARVSLFRCLVDAGWEPSQDVRTEMTHDLHLLSEPSHEGHGVNRH